MIKKNIHISILGLLLFSTTISHAQLRREKIANKDFDNYAYINSIEIYERMADKGYINTSILENLANAYYFNGKFVEANKWYSQLFDANYPDKNIAKIPSEYYYRYAQTLKTIGDYKKADLIMNKFVELESRDSRSLLYENNKDYLSSIEARSGKYIVKDLSINSQYSDYGGTILGNEFIFTSARAGEKAKKNQIHSWTNESFTSLYSSKILPDGSFEQPVLFDWKMEANVNEASAVFTKDGNTMYYTQNNTKNNGKSKQNTQDVSVLKIYKATKDVNGNWSNFISLSINSDNFNTAHPALTPDEKWLYFASDRHGTIGKTDLFRVSLLDQGQLGPVENLGSVINTSGRETFPFISSDHQLYFASDGHPGLGGLDVFVSKIYPNGSFGPVVNMGKPINSGFDDFALYIDTKLNKGFVSSNREGGKGSDDIYFVDAKSCQESIKGKAYDIDSKKVLSDVMLIVSDAMYQKRDTIYSDKSGNYLSPALECNSKFRIIATTEGYNTIELSGIVSGDNAQRTIDIAMEVSEKQVSLNDDLFEMMILQPIYFDFDKSKIREDAAIELMKIVEVMKQYPQMKIDVRSHTDSRGSAAYNLALSDRRAKATLNWMEAQGIEADRLTGKGYGDTQLLNKCKKGIPCSAAEQQLNRRSEFIITQIKK